MEPKPEGLDDVAANPMKLVDDLRAFLESVEQVNLKPLEVDEKPQIEQDQVPVPNPFSTTEITEKEIDLPHKEEPLDIKKLPKPPTELSVL